MKHLYFFSTKMVFRRIPYYTFSRLLREKTELLLVLVSWFCLSSAVSATTTTVNVSTLNTTLALTTGDYVITGSNTGSSVGSGGAVFSVASGQTVNITLDNVNFKTINTASTNFITAAAGSKINIILKGINIFDWNTVTSGGSIVSITGGGTTNTFSEAAEGGTMNLWVASNATFQTIYYAPSTTTDSLRISGGTYICENTGTKSLSYARVIHTQGTGSANLMISGGTFKSLNTSTGSNTSATIYINSGSSSVSSGIAITDGIFSSVSGKVLVTGSGKPVQTLISGGSFFNNGTSSLLVNSGTGTMSITAPANRYLHLTDKNGNKTTLAPGSTDATTISGYNTSLNIAPCYVIRFYSGTDKSYVHLQESDVPSVTLEKYSRNWFSVNTLGNWTDNKGVIYLDNTLISFATGNYILDLYPILSTATYIDISTLTSAFALTTGEYVLYGDNTGTGSTIPTSIFTIASGNTVTVTLYDMKFKTNNTAATKLIDAASGSCLNLILKGDNVFDGQTLTSASNGIAMAGGSTFNFSASENGGKFTMRTGASTGTFQTIAYNPSGTTGKFSISGGTYQCEYTGTGVSAARVIGTGGTGTATMTLSGATFENLNSGTGLNNGNLFVLGSGTTTSGITCTINDGIFRALGGNAINTTASKLNQVIINGGNYFNSGVASLFSIGAASGGIAITASSSKNILITNSNNDQIRLRHGTTDATAIGSYKTSLTTVPYYVVDFYSDASKTKLYTQISDVASFALQGYNESWFTPALSSFHEWTDGRISYMNTGMVTFAPGNYVLEVYPSTTHNHWYVTVNGNGTKDGTTWATAWTWTKIFNPTASSQTLTSFGVADGDTIVFAAGSYDVSPLSGYNPTINARVCFLGGYNDGDNLNYVPRNSSKYPVFTTKAATTSATRNRPLFLLGAPTGSGTMPLTIDGFIFDDILRTTGTSTSGSYYSGIITIPATGAITQDLVLRNCTFSNITATGAVYQNKQQVPVLSDYGAATGNLLIENCFWNNCKTDIPANLGSSTIGQGAFAYLASAWSGITINKSVFQNCISNSKGHFVIKNGAIPISFENCRFSGNTLRNFPDANSSKSMFYGMGTNGATLASFTFKNCALYNNSSPANALFSSTVGAFSSYNSYFINNTSYPYASTTSTAWNSSSNNYDAIGLSTSSAVTFEASIVSNNVYNRTLTTAEQSLYTAVNTNLSAVNIPAETSFYKDVFIASTTSLTPKNCILNGAFYGAGNGVTYAPTLNKTDLLTASDCSNLISGVSTVDDILAKYDNTTGTYWKSNILDISYSGLLTYKPDSDGFILPDFGNAGYRNGKEEYPNYQPKSTRIVTVTPLPDPNADNTANIQTAINQVSAMTPDSIGMRGVVYISAGKYYLDGSLKVSASGVVIRGAGRGSDVANPADLSSITWLHARGTGTGKEITILQAGPDVSVSWTGTVKSNMTHTGKVGDYKIMIENPSLFSVGDNVCVCMPWTSDFLTSIWYGGNSNCDRWSTGSGFEYNRYITAIEGNVITLDAPLYMTYDLKYAQAYLRKIAPATVAKNIGLENFRISMDRTPVDTLTAPDQNCIRMNSLENCWVKGLRLSDYVHSGLTTTSCTRMTIDDVWSVDASGYKSAGSYYSFESYNRSQLILYRNCQARGGRHDYIGNGSQLVSGIALVGFQSQQNAGSEAGHRNFGQGVLFDNWYQWDSYGTIGAFLRNNMGTMHGWGAVHSVMWNCNMGNGAGTIYLDKVPTTQNYAIACNAATIRRYTGVTPCETNSFTGAVYKTGYVEGQKPALAIRPTSLYVAQNYYRWKAKETRGSIYIAGGYASVSGATAGQTVNIYPGNNPTGKLFDHWEVVKGDVTLSGNTFVMGTNDVVIIAVYKENSPSNITRLPTVVDTQIPYKQPSVIYTPGYIKNTGDSPVYVYSIDGRLFHKTELSLIDISGWPAGVYIVRTNKEVLKIIK